MTLRTRRHEGGIRARLGRLVDTEERQQTTVTALFIGAIALVVLILIGSFVFAWYNDNLRPLARVGGVEVQPQQVRDYVRLEAFRINRDRSRLTQAQIDGVIDESEAAAREQELTERAQSLQTSALDDVIDLLFQSQLATAEGITVSDAEVDAALADELATEERRHVQSITIEPEIAEEADDPTVTARQEAEARAEAALAALLAGADWAEVAREYGTDPVSQNGGDLGFVIELAVGDQRFAEKLFELEPGGTTDVIFGDDFNYHVGRVVEIQPAGEEPGLHSRLNETVSDAAAKSILRLEGAAQSLEARRIAEALAVTPEQVDIGVIYVEGQETGDPDEAEGEVDYSEIVFAPNDNLDTAPDLDEDDPAWAAAQAEADAAFAELSEITDDEELETTFGEIAAEQSNSPTAEENGRAGFVTRSIPPVAVGDALWDGEHEEFDLIGPVRGDGAWYVLMFHEKRESVATRLQEVRDALAAPDADFGAIAAELSDGGQAEDGGKAGWFTRQGLEDSTEPEFAEAVFALDTGEVSDALELGLGHYFVKVFEKTERAFDALQVAGVEATAFTDWYADKRLEAEEDGTIVIPGQTDLPEDIDIGDDLE